MNTIQPMIPLRKTLKGIGRIWSPEFIPCCGQDGINSGLQLQDGMNSGLQLQNGMNSGLQRQA